MTAIVPWSLSVKSDQTDSSAALYFDYAATTPVDEQVIESMTQCLGRKGSFGNPASSSHPFGLQAKALVEQAREQVAHLVGATVNRIIWTSGATESNNLALKGLAQVRGGALGHIISSQLEHKAVLDTLVQLEEQGFQVTYLAPDRDGAITAQAVSDALRTDTLLVTLMLVNNELGTLTDIASIGQLVRDHGALFHVDAAQATGKVSINLATLAVDLMSFSAHKTYGPKGIGALYTGPRTDGKLHAQIHGGGHEQGLRSGTLATHQIVGMGKAFALAATQGEQERTRIQGMRQRLLSALEGLPINLNGSQTAHVPNILSLTPRVDIALGEELAISSTSACNSASNAPSHVLLALGLRPAEALRTLRLSLGRYTTEHEIDRAATLLRQAILAPIP